MQTRLSTARPSPASNEGHAPARELIASLKDDKNPLVCLCKLVSQRSQLISIEQTHSEIYGRAFHLVGSSTGHQQSASLTVLPSRTR